MKLHTKTIVDDPHLEAFKTRVTEYGKMSVEHLMLPYKTEIYEPGTYKTYIDNYLDEEFKIQVNGILHVIEVAKGYFQQRARLEEIIPILFNIYYLESPRKNYIPYYDGIYDIHKEDSNEIKLVKQITREIESFKDPLPKEDIVNYAENMILYNNNTYLPKGTHIKRDFKELAITTILDHFFLMLKHLENSDK